MTVYNKIHIVIIACRLQLVYMRMMQSKFAQTNSKKSNGGRRMRRSWIRLCRITPPKHDGWGRCFEIFYFDVVNNNIYRLNQPYLNNKTLISTLCRYNGCDFWLELTLMEIEISKQLKVFAHNLMTIFNPILCSSLLDFMGKGSNTNNFIHNVSSF